MCDAGIIGTKHVLFANQIVNLLTKSLGRSRM